MLNSWQAVHTWDDFIELFFLSFIRVTREHREMLVKLAKQNTNKAKDSLRKIRTNAINKVKKSKDKASEDTIRLIEKQVLWPTDVMFTYLTQKSIVHIWNEENENRVPQFFHWHDWHWLSLSWAWPCAGPWKYRGGEEATDHTVFQALSWALYNT